MITKKQLALNIIDTWNSHNLDAFMELHGDTFEYSSPIISKYAGQNIDKLTDKQIIREFWQKILEKFPNIHSDVIQVFEGSSSAAVYYKTSAKENPVIDVMHFDENNKVVKLEVYYS